MAFNIVEKLYNQYQQRFPGASMDNFLGYIKQNYPVQYRWAQKFADSAKDYATGKIDDLKELSNQTQQNVQKQAKEIKQNVTQKANTIKNSVKQNAKIAEQRLQNTLAKEGLTETINKTPNVASKASNIVKGGAKVASKAAGGIVAGALDIPQTIGDWTREGANAVTRGLDVAGNALTVGAPYAARVPGWKGKALAGGMVLGGMGLHTASDIIQGKNNNQQDLYNPAWDTIENPLLKVTDEEKQRYYNYVNDEANQLQQQAKQGIQQTQDAIDWYNNFDNRMANEYNVARNEIENTDMSLPEVPRTGLNFSSGTNTSPNNLTPLNEPPNASNINNANSQQGNIQMSNQQPMMSNNQQMANIMDDIQMLSSFARGLQQGNQLPNLGVSQEELNAYSNMLEQYGKNIAGLQQDVDAYRKALQANVRNQAMAGVLDSVGGILQATRLPKQNAYALVPGLGMVGYAAPQDTSNLNNLGQGLRNANKAQLDAFRTNMELQNQIREAEQNRATQFADLLTAARLSNQTGLPLNVARNMSATDYINYIQPTQDARNEAQKIALQGVSDLITGKQQQGADYTKAIDVQSLINTGAYEREMLGQLGQNQRAKLDAFVRTNLNELDNRTKLRLEYMTGINAKELERLKQSDPNAFYRAIGPVLMAATYTTGPASNLAGNYIYNLLNTLYPQEQQQSGNTTAVDSYWSRFNR